MNSLRALFSRQTLIILGFYAASHVAWGMLLGWGFKGYKLLDFSHFPNPQWLKSSMLDTLLNLHSQPPLMSLLIGGIGMLTDHYEAAFRMLYFASGALALLAIDRSLRLLGTVPWLCHACMLLLCATPGFYMYGTWYFSTHLEFCISAFMVLGIVRFFCEPQSRRTTVAWIFACFALLGLIRPQWHLILFLAMAAVLGLAGGRDAWRRTALFALIFILPIGGWYMKNYVMFSFFGGSSWLGANMAQVALQTGIDDIIGMKQRGAISADFPGNFRVETILARTPSASIDAESALSVLKSVDPDYVDYLQKNGKPIYLIHNLNYAGMVPSARQDQRDAMTIILSRPWDYIALVARKMYYTSLMPSFMHGSANLLSAEKLVQRVIPSPTAQFIIFRLSAFCLYFLIPLALAATAWRSAQRRPLIYFLLGMIGFLVITSCALNGYEQERMRWGWQPMYIVLAAVFLERLRFFVRRGSA